MTLIFRTLLFVTIFFDFAYGGFINRSEKDCPRVMYAYGHSAGGVIKKHMCHVDSFANPGETFTPVPCELSCGSSEYPEPFCPAGSSLLDSWNRTEKFVIDYHDIHYFKCVSYAYCSSDQAEHTDFGHASKKHSGINSGAVAGIAIATCTVGAILGVCSVWFYRKLKKAPVLPK
jgi:hypothetical protein